MPAVTIRAGMTLDIPNRDEVAQITGDATRAELEHYRAQEREQARGVKVDGQIYAVITGLSDAATTLWVGDYGPVPDQGWLWNLKLISVQFNTADTVKAYLGTSKSETTRLISVFGSSNVSQIDKFSSSQVILKPGQSVVLVTVAHVPTAVFMTYAQAPAEMAYKVFD